MYLIEGKQFLKIENCTRSFPLNSHLMKLLEKNFIIVVSSKKYYQLDLQIAIKGPYQGTTEQLTSKHAQRLGPLTLQSWHVLY